MALFLFLVLTINLRKRIRPLSRIDAKIGVKVAPLRAICLTENFFHTLMILIQDRIRNNDMHLMRYTTNM